MMVVMILMVVKVILGLHCVVTPHHHHLRQLSPPASAFIIFRGRGLNTFKISFPRAPARVNISPLVAYPPPTHA